MEKEFVYVVVSNNIDEVMGEVDGVFKTFEDAKRCLEDIKKDWINWAGDDEIHRQEEDDYLSLTTSSEFMEVFIKKVELK